jgi:Protein of unknown function (DUF1761)
VLFDYFGDLNWLAVIVAALAYFIIGAVWYSNALFAKQYRAALGITEGSGTPAASLLIINFVGWLVAAIALGLVSLGIGADSAGDGAVLGLVVGVGFVLSHLVVTLAFDTTRDYSLAWISGLYYVIGFVVMGVILAVWT